MFTLTSLVLAAGWSFSVDGTLSNAGFTPLPGGGAVVTVAQVPMLLDEPRRYDFVVEREAAVTRISERGRLVGVALVGAESSANEFADLLGIPTEPPKAPAAPPTFSREQIAGLRGFAFIPGAEVPTGLVDQLVPSRSCIGVISSLELGGSSSRNATEPKVPPGFVCVVLERAWTVDVSAARFIRDDDSVLDADALLRAQKVESLQLNGSQVAWPVVAKLPLLRELVTRWPQAAVEAVSFPTLEVLRVEETVPTDYRALAAPKLKTLIINSRSLTTLPTKLPSLIRGAISAPLVDDATFQAFVTAHPQARVERGWEGLLRFEAAGVDGVRVRSGGRLYGSEASKVLAEVRKPEQVAQLLGTLAVDELSAGYCSCGGGPTVQFLEGDFVLAEVSVQHGQALRWQWPADALLKTDGLAKLLAAWGVREPLEEWNRSTAHREAAAVRRARYAKLLPRALAPYAMDSAVGDPDLATGLKRLEGTGLERLAFYLRLEGTAVEGLEASPADRIGDEVLNKATPADLAKLAARADPEVDAGLRERLFHVAGPTLLSSPALAPHLPRLLLQAMDSASTEARAEVLHAVAAGKGAGPTAALRAVLTSQTLGANERELAALELVKRKDSKSSAAARAVCEGKDSAACVEVRRRVR